MKWVVTNYRNVAGEENIDYSTIPGVGHEYEAIDAGRNTSMLPPSIVEEFALEQCSVYAPSSVQLSGDESVVYDTVTVSSASLTSAGYSAIHTVDSLSNPVYITS